MGNPSVSTIGNGKPAVTGGVLNAPLGTDRPTDVDSAVDAAAVKLGYVSEDGLQPDGERSTNAVKDWAGDIIAQLQSEHSSRFTFTLYGAFDGDVLKASFGESNVTATGGGKYTVTETGDPLPHSMWIFEVRGDGGKKLRIVIPDGQPSSVSEGPMVAADLQSFTLTIEAFKDDNGVKVYRYYDDGTGGSAPAVASHTPASLAVAGGTLTTLTGSNFTGATAVTFGGTAATNFTVVSDTKIVATAPAKTAGSVNVVVTTPAGASTAHSVTYA